LKRKEKTDLKDFFLKVGVITLAVLGVLYLAKVWFVDQKPSRQPPPEVRISREGPSKVSPGTEKGKVISWRDAAKHYGEHATVEGTIVATHNSGKACFLNFHPNYRRYFTAVIFASAFSRFPKNPENFYSGKRVRVSGYIKEYKGSPEIILNDPKQIEVLK
jgi:DNA/RNA endonuclease YhcR with UshA esterase domain